MCLLLCFGAFAGAEVEVSKDWILQKTPEASAYKRASTDLGLPKLPFTSGGVILFGIQDGASCSILLIGHRDLTSTRLAAILEEWRVSEGLGGEVMRSDENGSDVARYRLSKPTFGAFESALSIPIGSLLRRARPLSPYLQAIWKLDLGIPVQALPERLPGGYFDITPVNLDRLEVITTSSPRSFWLLLAIVLPPGLVMLLSVWIALRVKIYAAHKPNFFTGPLNPIVLSGTVGGFIVLILAIAYVPKDGIDELGAIWFGGPDPKVIRSAAVIFFFTFALLEFLAWHYLDKKNFPREPLIHTARKDLYFPFSRTLGFLLGAVCMVLWIFGDDWVGNKSFWGSVLNTLGFMGYFAAISSNHWIGASGSERAKLHTQMLSRTTAEAMGVNPLPVVYGTDVKNEIDVVLGNGAILVTPRAEDDLDEEEMRFAMARCYALALVPNRMFLWIGVTSAVIAFSPVFSYLQNPTPTRYWMAIILPVVWASYLLYGALRAQRQFQLSADEGAFRRIGNLDAAQSAIAKMGSDPKKAAQRIRRISPIARK